LPPSPIFGYMAAVGATKRPDRRLALFGPS
jgi:hypothetical protein